MLCNHIISKQGECVHILKIPCLQTVPFLRSLTLQAGQVDIHFSKMPRNPYRLFVKYFPQTPEKSEKNFKKILSEQRHSGLKNIPYGQTVRDRIKLIERFIFY